MSLSGSLQLRLKNAALHGGLQSSPCSTTTHIARFVDKMVPVSAVAASRVTEFASLVLPIRTLDGNRRRGESFNFNDIVLGIHQLVKCGRVPFYHRLLEQWEAPYGGRYFSWLLLATPCPSLLARSSSRRRISETRTACPRHAAF